MLTTNDPTFAGTDTVTLTHEGAAYEVSMAFDDAEYLVYNWFYISGSEIHLNW
jgi:hypothetical protein